MLNGLYPDCNTIPNGLAVRVENLMMLHCSAYGVVNFVECVHLVDKRTPQCLQ